MTISIVHPSRNRPERAFKVWQNMMSNASGKHQIEYLLSIDSTDEKQKDYQNYFDNLGNTHTLISDNRYCVDAINKGAYISVGQIIVVTSDDFDSFPKDWDEMIVNATEGKDEFLLKTFDGAQKWIATLPIMSRSLYKRLGYIYNGNYLHMFADTDLSCVCDLLGVTIYRNDIVFPHNHYTKLKNKDEVNERNDATWIQGEMLFLNRFKTNFGLNYYSIKGEIQDQRILAWIKSKL